MNLNNMLNKINKEISLADYAIENSKVDFVLSHHYWEGYKKGLEYAKNILIKKIELRKKD